MATLHDTTVLTKKIGLWAGIGIVVLILAVFLFRGARAVKNYFLPPGPPPPTVQFGKLKPIEFPESVTKEKLSYSIETISGVLPSFSSQVNVYEIQHTDPGLLNLQRAREKASSVGFRAAEKKEEDDQYSWRDGSPLNRVLTINTTTFNFDVRSNFATSSSFLAGGNVPTESSAVEISKNFVDGLSLLSEDLDLSKTVPELYQVRSGVLIPASSLSNAQIIRVDFYQKDVDGLPMYYPHPPHSTMNFLVGSTDRSSSVVESSYFRQHIGSEGSTYPIKTVDQAYKELQNGKAYISSFYSTDKNVKITDVTLGYYLSDKEQEHLLPILVFHGDNNFMAYVPAIVDSWLDTSKD